MRVRRWTTGLALSIAAALLAAAAWAGTAQTRPAAKPAAAAVPAPQVETAPDKSLGSRSAPVVMEVFSDYSCPVCKSFYLSSVRPLLESYVSSGKVYLIHRYFPLKGVTGHEHSREAALYANAAARIGRFQEVDAALYDKQEVWSCNNGRNSQGAPCSQNGSVLAAVAAVLSPKDLKRVREMVESGKLDAYVENDYNAGTSRGVRSTPTIYLTAHGKTDLIPGTVSYSLLKRFIDEQLQTP